jgi:hypothetical protein
MNVLFTVLFAFAIGYFVKHRGLAIVTYLALDAIVFCYQTLHLLLEWLAGGSEPAFGPNPSGGLPLEFSNRDLTVYGVVNLVIIAVGIGLVLLGTKVAARRAEKKGVIAVA